jgi:tetratricopeptide (TPR) repeat protein
MRKLSLLLLLQAAIFPSDLRIKFARLDPTSISQNIAFYELYSETDEGKKALQRIESLLVTGEEVISKLCKVDINALNQLVNRTVSADILDISEQDLLFIEKLGKRFLNRHLVGNKVWSEEEVLSLAPEEIDLCRALLLAEEKLTKKKIRTFEAMVDLMALQVQSRVPQNASHEKVVHEINKYIFFEQGFRFPPHSLSTKEIDQYTLLPSVIDSRKGVCLGVSILYLCIAQRLGLPLEIITPPGHIYVRLPTENGHINIETTARGIHVPSKRYLSLELKSLPKRTIKEVIGLSFVNQASVSLGKEDYTRAQKLYEKAQKYLPDDWLIEELLGFTYLFTGNAKKGRSLLVSSQVKHPSFLLTKNSLVEDYLHNHCDIDSLQKIFSSPEDLEHEALIDRLDMLEKISQKFPYFRMALLQTAGIYLHLSRPKEAMEILKKIHHLDPDNPSINYYLTTLFYEREDLTQAWYHFTRCYEIMKKENHFLEELGSLKMALSTKFPRD